MFDVLGHKAELGEVRSGLHEYFMPVRYSLASWPAIAGGDGGSVSSGHEMENFREMGV